MISIQNLSGPRGLLTAILVQAIRDIGSNGKSDEAIAARHEARRWIGSPEYQSLLKALELPPDLIPLGLEPMGMAAGD